MMFALSAGFGVCVCVLPAYPPTAPEISRLSLSLPLSHPLSLRLSLSVWTSSLVCVCLTLTHVSVPSLTKGSISGIRDRCHSSHGIREKPSASREQTEHTQLLINDWRWRNLTFFLYFLLRKKL